MAIQNDDGQIVSVANRVLQFTMFHLVKELRDAGVEGPISEMQPAVKSALVSALFGGISEINSDIQAAEVEDWESNSRVWALLAIYGEENKAEALHEIGRIKSGETDSEFGICGMYAARSFITSLESGDSATTWLDSYEGIFAAMVRLSKVIA